MPAGSFVRKKILLLLIVLLFFYYYYSTTAITLCLCQTPPWAHVCLFVSLFASIRLFWVVPLQISKSSFSDAPAPRGEGGGREIGGYGTARCGRGLPKVVPLPLVSLLASDAAWPLLPKLTGSFDTLSGCVPIVRRVVVDYNVSTSRPRATMAFP